MARPPPASTPGVAFHPERLEAERTALLNEVSQMKKRHHRAQRAWSFGHHFASYATAALTLGSALLVQIPSDAYRLGLDKDVLLGFVSFAAAVLATIAASGGFRQKWRTNRTTRSRLDCLRLDLQAPKPDLAKGRSDLKAIISRHDQAILDAEPGSDAQEGG